MCSGILRGGRRRLLVRLRRRRRGRSNAWEETINICHICLGKDMMLMRLLTARPRPLDAPVMTAILSCRRPGIVEAA